MLTTKDNRFHPYEDFENWYKQDCASGHYSCALLDRIAQTSKGLTEIEENEEINRAILEIIKEDILGIYTKVDVEIELSV